MAEKGGISKELKNCISLAGECLATIGIQEEEIKKLHNILSRQGKLSISYLVECPHFFNIPGNYIYLHIRASIYIRDKRFSLHRIEPIPFG